MMKYLTLRTLIFVCGATGAVAVAVDQVTKRGGVSIAELIAVSCTALAAFALRWPSDVTATQAKEREARARRESILPPLGDEVEGDLVDLIRDVKTERKP